MNASLSARAALMASRCWAKLKLTPGGGVADVDGVGVAMGDPRREPPVWASMLRRRGCQRRQHTRTGLHGGAAVTEVEGPQTAEFFATASATGAAVQRLRHHIAVSAAHGSDIGRDHVQAAMAVGEF